MAELFEKNSKGIPKEFGFTDQSGNYSKGFYAEFLYLSKWETDPIPFFEILEIDQKIENNWTNPQHIEDAIFYYKAIEIIKDKKVTF